MPRVFISHANADGTIEGLVPQLTSRLGTDGHDVLIDIHRLDAGCDWRQEIYSWIAMCDVAIVLFSPSAIKPESIWVPRELSLMVWRRALDPSLLIIPVLCGGTSVNDVQQFPAIRDLRIDQSQFVDASTTDAVGAIATKLAGLRPPTESPLDKLADSLRPLLREFDDDVLRAAGDLVPLDVLPGCAVPDIRRDLAIKLLSTEPQTMSAVLDYLATRGSAAARRDLADATRILCANWVKLDAAHWIAREVWADREGAGRRALLLDLSTKTATEMYVQRASLRPPATQWKLIVVTGVTGEDAVQDLSDEIEQALENEIFVRPDPLDRNPELRRKNAYLGLRKQRVAILVLMALQPGFAAALPELRNRFPYLDFLLLDLDSIADTCDLQAADFCQVEPRLKAGEEDQALQTFDTLTALYGTST